MRSALAIGLLLATAGWSAPASAREVPAWAEAGEVERARAAADIVVVVAIDRVTVERGSCVVLGRIVGVERGGDLRLPREREEVPVRAGSPIIENVPCGPRRLSSIRRHADPAAVRRAARARLWLFAVDGALIDYQPL